MTLIHILSALLFSPATAGGVTIGAGVGALIDVPVDTSKAAACDGDFVFLDVQGVTRSNDKPCDGAVRLGGQLVVPVRVHLSDLATLRVTPGFQVNHYGGTVSWSDPGDTGDRRTYTGHTAAVLRPQVVVGGEFAFLSSGVTPYVGAGVGIGANIDVHSLGPNADGNHLETMEAFEQRSADHCNNTRECNWDAARTTFGVSGELLLGVRTADPSKPGFFAEASYNLLGLGERTPVDYDGDVTLGPSKLNSIGLTAGLIIPIGG